MNKSTRDVAASPDPQEAELDIEITSIRAESKSNPTDTLKIQHTNTHPQVHNLQRRKRFLASSLLSSDSAQKLLRKPPPALLTSTSIHDDFSPLAQAAGPHARANHYRIAFGTTAFPFQDPSATAGADNLLGVRIDVCARNGRFAKPYYVLLRRRRGRGHGANANMSLFQVHRHTVPAFIALSKLESVYLPVPRSMRKAQAGEEEEENDTDAEDGEMKAQKKRGGGRQDLRGFVRELRRELVAWHLRCDAVDLLREKLDLRGADSPSRSSERGTNTGIVSLAPTAVETRYVRLEWDDGRVGRFKLSNTGIVERAVVIGDEGRDQRTEEAMTGAGGRVETLLERLRRRDGPAA